MTDAPKRRGRPLGSRTRPKVPVIPSDALPNAPVGPDLPSAEVVAPPEPEPPAVVVIGSPKDDSRRQMPTLFNEELAERITDYYAEGMSLLAIASLPGMPSLGTLYRWNKTHAAFREMLDGARATRALNFEDKAIEAATSTGGDKDLVPSARLEFDAYQWGAEKNDPARYGKKTTISGDASNPIVIQVVTGVPAPERPRVLEMGPGGIVREVVAEVVETHDDR